MAQTKFTCHCGHSISAKNEGDLLKALRVHLKVAHQQIMTEDEIRGKILYAKK